MKSIIKQTFFTLCIVALLGLSSCTKQGGERLRRERFQVIAINKVSGSPSDGWQITTTVANNTASNMRITAAEALIYQNGRKVAKLTLNGEVFLPRRRCSQIEIPLRLTISNPIAAFSTLNRVRKGDFSGINIDYSITLAAFTSHRVFEQKGVSLEQLAKQFNLGLKN